MSSPMHLFWLSSHIMTLLVGYRGFLPPPTMAIKLHRNSISTIPIPVPPIDRRTSSQADTQIFWETIRDLANVNVKHSKARKDRAETRKYDKAFWSYQECIWMVLLHTESERDRRETRKCRSVIRSDAIHSDIWCLLCSTVMYLLRWKSSWMSL